MKKISLMILSMMLVGTVCHAKVTATNNDEGGSNGVEAVDLGLSVKWANMNVGANKDSGFGSYFAWGEIKPKKYYSWNTYVWSKENTQFLVKYSVTDRKTQLDPSDDAAHATWGGDWRMPTVDECEELVDPDKCAWEWMTKDGVLSMVFTGHRLSTQPVPVRRGV